MQVTIRKCRFDFIACFDDRDMSASKEDASGAIFPGTRSFFLLIQCGRCEVRKRCSGRVGVDSVNIKAALFGSQSLHWFDRGGATSGQQTRKRCDSKQHTDRFNS